MTDLHALITEMADELDHNRQCLLDDRRVTHPLADKARAALAEPEPKGPTDDELNALWNCCGIADEYGHHEGNFFDFARAVLARWGNCSAPQPIPVSERLPAAEDCDAENCIWLWDTERRWVRQCREAASSNTWVGASWLPGHALPLPIN